jgi:hypothetical protein
MISAIVVEPGKAQNKSDRFYVVVKIPTINCSISSIPVKLPKLNVFQKGVAFFLLAGLKNTDEISKAMGITDSDFTNLLLSELEGSEYAEKKGAQEFAPTKKLRQEFQNAVGSTESRKLKLVAFLPVSSGTRMVKVAELFSPVQPTEVDQSVSPAKVAVGTEGKPLQVDCLVSEWVSWGSAKVDRATAKEWLVRPPKEVVYPGGEGSATRVEVLDTKSMAYVLQCQLVKPKEIGRSMARKANLLDALTVRFPGDKKPNQHLQRLLIDITENDAEFAEEFLDSLARLLGSQDSAQIPDRIMDEEAPRDIENTVTRQHGKKKALTWLVELLNSRIQHLGTSSLESRMVAPVSLSRQVADRLVELGSSNRKPPIPPLEALQFEVILAGELHNELDVTAAVGAWLLLESTEALNQLIQLNSKFIDGVCDIFVNTHVEVSKDMRETFQYLGSIK